MAEAAARADRQLAADAHRRARSQVCGRPAGPRRCLRAPTAGGRGRPARRVRDRPAREGERGTRRAGGGWALPKSTRCDDRRTDRQRSQCRRPHLLRRPRPTSPWRTAVATAPHSSQSPLHDSRRKRVASRVMRATGGPKHVPLFGRDQLDVQYRVDRSLPDGR